MNKFVPTMFLSVLISSLALAGFPPVSTTGENYIQKAAGNKVNASAVNLSGSNVTGGLGTANNGVPLATKHYEIDVYSTAATEDGSISRPFKTIQAFINQVVTNGDNASYAYTGHVHPGVYPENLTFNSLSLVNLTLFGDPDYGNSTIIQPTANTDSINSTANNGNLQTLNLTNLYFIGNVHMVGDTNHTNFGANAVQFQNVIMQGGNQQLTFNNIASLNFIECAIIPGSAGTLFKNISFVTFSGGFGILAGPLNLVNDNAANVPAGFALNFALFERTVLPLSTITVDAGSFLQTREGVRVGTSGGSISLSGGYDAYTSFIRSNITINSGGTYNNNGSVQGGTITNSGTIANKGHAGLLTAAIGASAADATNAAIIWKDGHLKSTQTTAPTATVNAHAGTGATCTVSNATDTSGTITLTTTATSPATGEQCKVNFNKAYGVAPICTVSPIDANAAAGVATQQAYFPTTTAVVAIDYGVLDATGHASNWNYHCIETQ